MANEAPSRDYQKWAKSESVADEIRSKAEPEALRKGKIYDPREFNDADPETKVGLTTRWLDQAKIKHNINPDKVYNRLGLKGDEKDADKVARIKEFQEGRGLRADGIIGPKTLEALDKASGDKGTFEGPVKKIKDGKETEETYSVPPETTAAEKGDEKTNKNPQEPENTSTRTTSLDIPSLETPVQKQIKEARAMLKVNQEKLDNEKGKEKTILATLNTKEADLKNKMTAQENAQKAFDNIDIPKALIAVETADQEYEDSILKESKAREEFTSRETPEESRIAFEKAQSDKASAKEKAKVANRELLEMEQKKADAKKILDAAIKDVENTNNSMKPLIEEKEYIKDNITVIEGMVKETQENIQTLESTQNNTEKSPKEISSSDVEDRKEDGVAENEAQAAEDAKKALETAEAPAEKEE